ncbi:hypothetical protein GGH94_002792 [Coemansia aciculifera]|uniref:Uncharacterized protein n=1 Tax=Coemansia aciculifera TaxID=417176 RepID=A0A9W8IKK6_9FUNG|nr:hypothetical protein GGH94_002792 [Coemansia aciculifera]
MTTDSLTDPSNANNYYEFSGDQNETQPFILEYTDEKGNILTPNFGNDIEFLKKDVKDIRSEFLAGGDDSETEITEVTFVITWMNLLKLGFDREDLKDGDSILSAIEEFWDIIDFGHNITVIVTKTKHARPAE